MSTSLIDALVERHGFALVDETNLDAFLEASEHSLLFFAGDADRLVESTDAAVILVELAKTFRGRFTPALVAKGSERSLQRRFLFNAFPAFVLMRRAGYLGSITRLLDWGDYLTEIPAILQREVSEPPPFRLPDGCAIPAPSANGRLNRDLGIDAGEWQ